MVPIQNLLGLIQKKLLKKLNILQNQLYNTFNDKFIIMNNRFPNNEEIEEMKKYFNLLDLEKMIKKTKK